MSVSAAYVLLDALDAACRLLARAYDEADAPPNGAYDHPALVECPAHPLDAIADAQGVVQDYAEAVRRWLAAHEREAA